MFLAFQFVVVVGCMHLIGSAFLFGCVGGPMGFFASPLLSIFGWFFVIPEGIGLSIQWACYTPDPDGTWRRVFAGAAISALVGGAVAAILVPKEIGNQVPYWIGGFLGGAAAATFSFLFVHTVKSGEEMAVHDS